MSDYSKITNFLSKDSLSLNDPAKYVKGSEIDAEYNAIAVAIATKADTASPTLTTPTMSSPTITGTITAAIANFSGLVTAALGLTVSGAAFNSRGITDNATAKALTLSGSGANSVTIANSAGNPTIGSSAGALSFNPVGQGEALRVTTGGASTVNYWSLSGAATGGRLTLLATGSDTNVGSSWQTKGSGSHLFVTETGTSAQVEILHTASADHYITLTGSAGGNPTIGTSAGNLVIAPAGLRAASIESPALTVNYLSISGATSGSAVVMRPNSDVDTNIGLTLDSKGSGQITFRTDPYGVPAIQAAVTHTASANRYITLTGSNGGNPTIGTSAGSLVFTSGGLNALLLTSPASAVNYVAIASRATGNGPSINAVGADGAIPLYLTSKGSQSIFLSTNGGATAQVAILDTASANRYITLTGSNGGNPTIGTSAGQLTLGTGSALATSATEGYVCIPTCAGTPTGVPAGAGAGNLPLIYDTTNNKLYAYNGAWKATAALT